MLGRKGSNPEDILSSGLQETGRARPSQKRGSGSLPSTKPLLRGSSDKELTVAGEIGPAYEPDFGRTSIFGEIISVLARIPENSSLPRLITEQTGYILTSSRAAGDIGRQFRLAFPKRDPATYPDFFVLVALKTLLSNAPFFNCPKMDHISICPRIKRNLLKSSKMAKKLLKKDFPKNSLEKTIERISLKINPSDKERKAASLAVEAALKICRKACKNSEPIVCGSFAKDTYLSGIRDIDLFLIVSDGKAAEVEGLLDAEACARALSPKKSEKKFASHEYFTCEFKGLNFDIVPAYRFKQGEELRSAVDRTPLHAEYVNANLKNREAARLFKAFSRGIGVYGADSKNQGFSGYLCELLAIRHETFEGILRAAEGISFPMEFPDPIDPERNVASAVSKDALETLKEGAKEFLKKPSDVFFFPKKSPARLPKMGKGTIGISYVEKNENEDAIYSKARKSVGQIEKDVSDLEFQITGRTFGVNPETGDTLLLLDFQKLVLPRTRLFEGPPLNVRRDYIEAFVAKHGAEKVYQEKGRLYAKDTRRIFEARQAVISMGRTFLPTFEIIDGQKAVQSIYSDLPEYERARIFRFLSKRRSWEI